MKNWTTVPRVEGVFVRIRVQIPRLGLAMVLVLGLVTIVLSARASSSSQQAGKAQGPESMPAGHHHGADAASLADESSRKYTVATANYAPPNVVLIDRHGKKVRIADLLARPRPVLLQFIFTSCSTVCPILSATFSQAQDDITSVSKDYEMISISIDPEYDTPERLDIYARRYHPTANWTFLTGRKSDISRILKAFDALYQNDNKMYHRPYTFLRAHSAAPWVRLEGHLSVSDLLYEYRGALHAAGTTGR